MRTSFALLVLDELPSFARLSLSDLVSPFRFCNEIKYDKLKASAFVNDGAMEAALKSLRPGITELEAAEQAAAFFRRNGANPGSVSVCFGDNAAYPHHTSNQRILNQNDTVLIDLRGLSQK